MISPVAESLNVGHVVASTRSVPAVQKAWGHWMPTKPPTPALSMIASSLGIALRRRRWVRALTDRRDVSSRFSDRKKMGGFEMGSLGRMVLCLDSCFFSAARVTLAFLSSRVVNIKVS